MKSQTQTDAEILSSAKVADPEPQPEILTEIRVRHTRSVHPVQCFCSIHRDLDIRKNPNEETERKEELDWYEGD
jgi:hypothetical protein